MLTYVITVTNINEGCDAEIEQQVTVSGCTTFLVKLTSNSNAVGPFNVYLDSLIYYSAQTKTQMLSGVTVQVACVTPTPTITPTNTVTPTITPTKTVTPTITPSITPTSVCLDTNWITWTGASGGTFSLIGGGTIGLTSSSTGSTTTQSIFGYIDLDCPDKNPNTTVQALENVGLYTYTFSQPVTNPLLAVYSLGRDFPSPITASLSADTPFTVYCSATTSPSYAITYDLLNQSFSGTEGYGIVQFVGTVTQIKLYYSPFEQYTQLSWGIPCIGIPLTPTPTPTVTPTPTEPFFILIQSGDILTAQDNSGIEYQH